MLPEIPQAGAEEAATPEAGIGDFGEGDLRARSADSPARRAPRRAPAQRGGQPPASTAASKTALPAEGTPPAETTAPAKMAQSAPQIRSAAPVPAPPLWASLIADPGYGLEHVAVAMVRRLGPEANDWVASARRRYPGAGQAGLARLIRGHFVRLGYQGGALAGAAGTLGAVAGPVLLAQVRARLVLHIAAAYGVDPVSDERARELVRLLRSSRVTTPPDTEPPETEPPETDIVDLYRVVARLALVRVASRAMPLGAAAVGGLAGGRDTEAVAARAIRFYRDKASAKTRPERGARESPPGP